jgi:hypothetical protein
VLLAIARLGRWSGWVKRGNFDTEQPIFAARPNSTYPFSSISFTTANAIKLRVANGGSINVNLVTNALFRDPSAWYHVCAVWDTTEAVTADRYLVYVNGVLQVTSGTLTLPINSDSPINDDNRNFIGVQGTSGGGIDTDYFDGYLADTYFVDGTALDPTSFGEFKSGVWIPKAYTGGYGTNGFHLEYNDNANDSSGTGNNWTATNIVAGDYMLDSPTNNYATLNPLDSNPDMTSSLADGNLVLNSNTTSGGNGTVNGTIVVTSGKWYFEATLSNYAGASALQAGFNNYLEGTGAGSGLTGAFVTVSTNATYMFAIDINNNLAWTGTDGLWDAGDPSAGTGGTSITINYPVVPFVRDNSGSIGNGGKWSVDFGQLGFTYTPPTGFLALSTANLPEPSISPLYGASPQDHFNTVLWSGNSSTQSITGVGFQPDLVWAKERTSTSGHTLLDTVRGVNLGLESDSTAAELNYLTDALTSFDADGFSLGSNGRINEISQTYVAWCWKASNAASVLNEAGSIDSQVSANTTAGFSIVSYTGTGVNATVGHGLNVAPDMVIVKSRGPVLRDWSVYNSSEGATKFMYLSTPAASTGSPTRWNNTEPTSDVFSLGTSGATNASENFIAYCFHSVEGYSKFGSYTGNGSLDGTFVYTGFRPAFILFKNTSISQSWVLYDTARDAYNAVSNYLLPDSPNDEGVLANADFLSNGFKLRWTSSINNSGNNFIYMAFAENPFKYANAR